MVAWGTCECERALPTRRPLALESSRFGATRAACHTAHHSERALRCPRRSGRRENCSIDRCDGCHHTVRYWSEDPLTMVCCLDVEVAGMWNCPPWTALRASVLACITASVRRVRPTGLVWCAPTPLRQPLRRQRLPVPDPRRFSAWSSLRCPEPGFRRVAVTGVARRLPVHVAHRACASPIVGRSEER